MGNLSGMKTINFFISIKTKIHFKNKEEKHI
jgi:hypothetical protein